MQQKKAILEKKDRVFKTLPAKHTIHVSQRGMLSVKHFTMGVPHRLQNNFFKGHLVAYGSTFR
jgi:hypothetical protein